MMIEIGILRDSVRKLIKSDKKRMKTVEGMHLALLPPLIPIFIYYGDRYTVH